MGKTPENLVSAYEGIRDGITFQKGAIVSKEKLQKNLELTEQWLEFFINYPDIFLDMIQPENSKFTLYPFQRIFLRATTRYRYHYNVATRGASKTFDSILGMILKCIFLPGSRCFICAPKKEQGAKIARPKIDEIFEIWPLLKEEVLTYNKGADYVTLIFKNGSSFDVAAGLDSTRGQRKHYGLIDEVRDQDGDLINEIILPLMNVRRRMANGDINENEPHQAQFFMTSASGKNTYAYEKLIELLVNEIISPDTTFVWGFDYRLPVLHGLLDANYINDLKMSATVKDESFAHEYLSRWTGGSKDAWFSYERLNVYRKLVNPESDQILRGQSNIFYLLSVDVGRLSCQTVVNVFKVYIRPTGFQCNLVNMYVLGKTPETKHFSIQARDLKRIIKRFDPKEILIDGNGLGVGLLDFMTKETLDDVTGEVYPGYSSFNDESYGIKLYPNTVNKLYIMKANDTLQGKIHSNCYSMIFSGKVRYLVKEQEIKTRLLETKKGQKMDTMEKMKRVLPHELTTILFEEMCNFRLKSSDSQSNIKLEKINSKKLSDKFSSHEYGLWRIKEIEEEYYSKQRKKSARRQLVFFHNGGE